MGKKGKAMREEKRTEVRRFYTDAQLEARDRAVVERFRESVSEECRRKLIEQQEKIFLEYMTCLLGISAKVLVEKFHWKRIPADGNYDNRNKLSRFSDYLMDELNQLATDDLDIKKYNDENYEKYGVRFDVIQEGDEYGI